MKLSKNNRAGYDHILTFNNNHTNSNNTRKNRKRTRKCIYWNPPFSKNVKTNFIAEFLKIVRNFPKNNVLAPIINTNKIKASYRTVPNMARHKEKDRRASWRCKKIQTRETCRVKAEPIHWGFIF